MRLHKKAAICPKSSRLFLVFLGKSHIALETEQSGASARTPCCSSTPERSGSYKPFFARWTRLWNGRKVAPGKPSQGDRGPAFQQREEKITATGANSFRFGHDRPITGFGRQAKFWIHERFAQNHVSEFEFLVVDALHRSHSQITCYKYFFRRRWFWQKCNSSIPHGSLPGRCSIVTSLHPIF